MTVNLWSSCPHIPISGLQACGTTPSLIYWGLSLGKCSNSWAMSPTPGAVLNVLINYVCRRNHYFVFDCPVLINNLVSSLKKKSVLTTSEVLPSTAGCLEKAQEAAGSAQEGWVAGPEKSLRAVALAAGTTALQGHLSQKQIDCIRTQLNHLLIFWNHSVCSRPCQMYWCQTHWVLYRNEQLGLFLKRNSLKIPKHHFNDGL